MKKLNLVGQRFGLLTVLSENGKTKSGNICWLCQCDCGKTTTVRGGKLVSHTVQTCGCSYRPKSIKKKHGKSQSPEYVTWASMIQRCHNENSDVFRQYGARGIIVCQRWRDSFEAFYADMGPRPSKKHSIDRVDNDGNYEPSNCRWATRKQQMNNRRCNRFYEIEGSRRTLMQWCEQYGMAYPTIDKRLRNGMTIHAALTTPINEKCSTRKNSRSLFT